MTDEWKEWNVQMAFPALSASICYMDIPKCSRKTRLCWSILIHLFIPHSLREFHPLLNPTYGGFLARAECGTYIFRYGQFAYFLVISAGEDNGILCANLATKPPGMAQSGIKQCRRGWWRWWWVMATIIQWKICVDSGTRIRCPHFFSLAAAAAENPSAAARFFSEASQRM